MTGFTPAATRFLRDLAAHNDREWFARNKSAYQAEVQEPMRRLVAALAPAMAAVDPRFDLDPLGGAVSRIHRDIRFSHDKSPYRTTQWIAFKPRRPDWQSRPAFFMEFSGESYRYGMGTYRMVGPARAAVLARIGARPGAFVSAVRTAAAAGLAIAGDAYRRPPRVDGQAPAEIRAWSERRNAYVVRDRAMDESFYGDGLAGLLAAAFTAAAPLYRFLAGTEP